MVIAWINQNAEPALNDGDNDSDGVIVYDSMSTQAFSSSIRTEVDIHPEIIVEVAAEHTDNFDRCISTDFNRELYDSRFPRELIPRSNNRLIIVNSNRPFHFSTAGGAKTAESIKKVYGYKEQLERKAFDQKHMIALVIIMKKIEH